MKLALNHTIGLVFSFVLAACSSGNGKGSEEATGGEGTISTKPSYASGGASNENAAAFFDVSSDGSCNLVVREETCAATAFETEYVPLDIYVMLDRSGSMCNCVDPVFNVQVCPDPNCRKSRLDAIREALDSFTKDTGSSGIGVGLGYFGHQPFGSADCNPQTYQSPSVAIGVLPDYSSTFMNSLNVANPVGETPTGAAIRGACTYAQSWKKQNLTHETVLLFVTDGKPEAPITCENGNGSCCPSLSDAVAAASDCNSGSTAIRTYVLGVGPYLSNLSEIAVAGGTKQAYLVEGGDVAGQVLAALNAIRGDAQIPCKFAIPTPEDGKTIDLTTIGLAYADSSCHSSVFRNVGSVSACNANGGYYFDDSNAPTEVRLCPSSCSQVSVAGGQLFYSVGCGWETPLQ
jgi:hypothetical protein